MHLGELTKVTRSVQQESCIQTYQDWWKM